MSVAAGQTTRPDPHHGAVVEMHPVEVQIRPMLTVNRAVDLFLADITRRGYSDRTRTSYSRTLDQLVDRLPVDLDISKVTADDISRFLDKWSRRSRGTQAYNESVVSSFFKFLYKSEKITRNPLDRLARTRRIPPAELDVVTVSNDDVRRMMMKAVSYPERMTIAILSLTGARRRAASRMRITDYDRDNRLLTFREKGGKTVTRQISDDLDALIEEGIRDGRYADQDYLIPPEGPLIRAGDRDDRCIYDIVKRVAKRAGVECHAHALRAAFACFYLEQNPGNTVGLKELLGHQSIQTTEVYLRKLDKKAVMESVRGLSWGVALTGIPSGSRVMSGSRYEETPDAEGYVYFIAAGDYTLDGTPVKIGYSADPASRLRDLQTSHPVRLTLIATFEATMAMEMELHLQFADSRLNGEWFTSSPELRKVIAKRGNSHVAIRHEIASKTLSVPGVVGAGGFEPPWDEGSVSKPDADNDPGQA